MYLLKTRKGSLYLCVTNPTQKESRINPGGFYWSPDFGNCVELSKDNPLGKDIALGEFKEVALVDVEKEDPLTVPPIVRHTDPSDDYKLKQSGDNTLDEIPF